jgi:hypothetical protein
VQSNLPEKKLAILERLCYNKNETGEQSAPGAGHKPQSQEAQGRTTCYSPIPIPSFATTCPLGLPSLLRRPRPASLGGSEKNIFRRSHHEKSANNHRRFAGAFMNERVAVRSSNCNSLPQK